MKSCKNLVISGGGATGCEFAADVKLRYPTVRYVRQLNQTAEGHTSQICIFKIYATRLYTILPINHYSVTVVDSRPTLLSAMSTSFAPIVEKTVKSMNIEHASNDRVEHWDEEAKVVQLKSGKTLPCDCHVAAHPQGGNCGFMPEGTKEGRDYAKVNDYFQIDNPVSIQYTSPLMLVVYGRRSYFYCIPVRSLPFMLICSVLLLLRIIHLYVCTELHQGIRSG